MADLPQTPKQALSTSSDASVAVNQRMKSDSLKLPAKKGKSSSARKKIIVIFVLCVAIFVIGALIIVAISRGSSNNNVAINPVKPTPTVIPRPTQPAEVVLGEPSVYANDPEILELEATMRSLNAEIDSDDLKESELTPPKLVTGIKF